MCAGFISHEIPALCRHYNIIRVSFYLIAHDFCLLYYAFRVPLLCSIMLRKNAKIAPGIVP